MIFRGCVTSEISQRINEYRKGQATLALFITQNLPYKPNVACVELVLCNRFKFDFKRIDRKGN